MRCESTSRTRPSRPCSWILVWVGRTDWLDPNQDPFTDSICMLLHHTQLHLTVYTIQVWRRPADPIGSVCCLAWRLRHSGSRPLLSQRISVHARRRSPSLASSLCHLPLAFFTPESTHINAQKLLPESDAVRRIARFFPLKRVLDKVCRHMNAASPRSSNNQPSLAHELERLTPLLCTYGCHAFFSFSAAIQPRSMLLHAARKRKM